MGRNSKEAGNPPCVELFNLPSHVRFRCFGIIHWNFCSTHFIEHFGGTPERNSRRVSFELAFLEEARKLTVLNLFSLCIASFVCGPTFEHIRSLPGNSDELLRFWDCVGRNLGPYIECTRACHMRVFPHVIGRHMTALVRYSFAGSHWLNFSCLVDTYIPTQFSSRQLHHARADLYFFSQPCPNFFAFDRCQEILPRSATPYFCLTASQRRAVKQASSRLIREVQGVVLSLLPLLELPSLPYKQGYIKSGFWFSDSMTVWEWEVTAVHGDFPRN